MNAQPALKPVTPPAPDPRPPRLLDQVRSACRVRHYSIRTEDAYVDWIKRLILFPKKRHPRETGTRCPCRCASSCPVFPKKRLPRETGTAEINAFLTHLAVGKSPSPGGDGRGEGGVSASTQNQAFSALLVPYQKVHLLHSLERKLPWSANCRPRPPSGAGNPCFPRRFCPWIPVRGSGGGITPIKPPSVRRSPRPCAVPALPSAPPAILFATRSRRICSRPAMRSEPSRNSWGTRAWPRRWCTRVYLDKGGKGVKSPLDA
jgi:hypothetical protein